MATPPEPQTGTDDVRLAALAHQSSFRSQLPRAMPELMMFAASPKDRDVAKALDAEMARLEQTVTRTGWTSWASTAALAALAWVFVSLLDAAAGFAWLRYAQFVALLSLAQEFVYALEYVLRPRRGFGLLAGSQLRVLRTAEAFPYARQQFLFYLVRAALLAVASYAVLPEAVGGWWLVPFILYLLIAAVMAIMLAMSAKDHALPKHEDAPIGELIGASVALAVAWIGLDALLASWQNGDLLLLKAAFVTIAGVHVLRGLTTPQYELPALERLQDIRRQLGFGQLSALEAVFQAEAALVGHMALAFLMEPTAAFIGIGEAIKKDGLAVDERVALAQRRLQALVTQEQVHKDEIRMQESLIGEAIRRSAELLQRYPSLLNARQGLLDELERYRKGTKNDPSLPLVEGLAPQIVRSCAQILQRLLDCVNELQASVATLAELAVRVDVRPDPELRARLERLQQDTRGRLEELRTADPTLAAASAGP
ncbi:MAG: hypothetical protein JNL82_37365 [Myxococcales bacterium]|nr:hypothetical protein [Myxococcales bacterium]